MRYDLSTDKSNSVLPRIISCSISLSCFKGGGLKNGRNLHTHTHTQIPLIETIPIMNISHPRYYWLWRLAVAAVVAATALKPLPGR